VLPFNFLCTTELISECFSSTQFFDLGFPAHS